MKQLLLFLALAAVGCGGQSGFEIKGYSRKPTTWHGNPGTAVTIRFATDAKQATRFACVRHAEGAEDIIEGAYLVPVMKRKPREVTVFASDEARRHSADLEFDQLEEGPETGLVVIQSCAP